MLEIKKNASDDGARDTTSNVKTSYVNDSDDGCVLVTTHGYKDGDERILDSGCTFHMNPNKTFFQAFENVDRENMTMKKILLVRWLEFGV